MKKINKKHNIKNFLMFKKTAFTLIELLVVIVIIGILATISVSTFQNYVEKARLAKTQAFTRNLINTAQRQQAAEEKNIFSMFFQFDNSDDINTSAPFIIDNSENRNHLDRKISNSENLTQSSDTPTILENHSLFQPENVVFWVEERIGQKQNLQLPIG